MSVNEYLVDKVDVHTEEATSFRVQIENAERENNLLDADVEGLS